jgi:hypothetical protein
MWKKVLPFLSSLYGKTLPLKEMNLAFENETETYMKVLE